MDCQRSAAIATFASRFFADKTRAPLAVRFLPVVTTATQKVGLAEKYSRVAASWTASTS